MGAETTNPGLRNGSVGVAYLLWFLLGLLGVHRFYLGRAGTGAAMLILTLLGSLTVAIFIGVPLFVAVGTWWLVDAFLIPGMARARGPAPGRGPLSQGDPGS